MKNNYKKLIPFIMKWEEGVKASLYNKLSWEDYFAECKKKGVHNIPGDKGGPTICGITIRTYTEYCAKKGLAVPTAETLLNINAEQWLDIYKTMFWDRCKGNFIDSQAVADMIVDWRWTSGVGAIKTLQNLLGTIPDGIIGLKTLGKLNDNIAKGASETLDIITQCRIDYYKWLAYKDPRNKKNLNGWINRANACKEWK